MKPIFYALFFSLLTVSLVYGQGPTITKSDYESFLQVGKEFKNFTDSVERAFDIGTLGGPNNWDFSSIEEEFSFNQVNVDPASTPFRDSFPNSSFCQFTTFSVGEVSAEAYSYLTLTDTEGLLDGSAGTTTAFGFTSTNVSKNSPAEIFSVFPLQLGSEWTYEGQSIDFSILNDVIIQNDTTEIVLTSVVDAYGTMTLPDGSSKEAIRINTIRSEVIPSFLPGFPADTFEVQSFSFVSPDGTSVGIAPLDDPGQVPDEGMVMGLGIVNQAGTASSLREIGRLIPGLSLKAPFPNPATGQVQVQYELLESTRLNLRVIDLSGRIVENLFEGRQNPGQHNLAFDTQRLAPGQYYIQLRSNGESAALPFRVVR